MFLFFFCLTVLITFMSGSIRPQTFDATNAQNSVIPNRSWGHGCTCIESWIWRSLCPVPTKNIWYAVLLIHLWWEWFTLQLLVQTHSQFSQDNSSCHLHQQHMHQVLFIRRRSVTDGLELCLRLFFSFIADKCCYLTVTLI